MIKAAWYSTVLVSSSLAVIACCSAQAQAQEWHVSDWGPAAHLPNTDNDGPGNRQGGSTCTFHMNQGSGYGASLLVYKSGTMLPYSSARMTGSGWERLRATIGEAGIADRYAPHFFLVNLCGTWDGSSVDAEYESGWHAASFEWGNDNFQCPYDKPVLLASWCKTAVWW